MVSGAFRKLAVLKINTFVARDLREVTFTNVKVKNIVKRTHSTSALLGTAIE